MSDINIRQVFDFHKSQNTISTLTAVHPHTRWGLVKSSDNKLIEDFVEKPFLYDYVNGGFFAFKKDFFDHLTSSDDCIMEANPFKDVVKKKQFSMFKHEGFWHSMDNYSDYMALNKIWDSGKIPWKKW